ASAAGSLFLRRVQAIQNEFTLTEANAAAVADICRRLDGIPLALELAAARARALSPQQIAQRLDQRFRLLTGGSRDLLPHQQTLRALIDWSYDLLGDVDRALLRRLAAFSGGWTLEAAESVGAGDGVEDWDVMDSLLSLVDKSLIVADGEGGDSGSGGGVGSMRYRMLETIRQYAREKLDESGEAEATAERHAQFFRRVAAEATGLDALDADGANLRAALDWHIANRQLDGAAAMAVSLKEFWWKRGRVGEGRSVLAQLLERGGELRNETRASLLGAAGWLAHLQADYAVANDCQLGSLDLCRAFGDAAGEADALNNLALSALAQGRTDEAAALFEESLAVAERLGDDAKRAARLSNLGMLAAEGGCYDEARARLSEARALYERLSDRAGAAACLCNLADLALRRAEWPEAEALSRESLHLFRDLNDAPGIAFSLSNLAEAALNTGDHAAVEARTREALTLCAAAGIRFLLPGLADLRARAFAAAGDADRSAEARAAADRLRETLNAPGAGPAAPRGSLEGSGGTRFATLTPEQVVAELLSP
ncbi:MAG TPA: tetratricopeptide repeat protein, partial [Armatimonadaceae bacterium]|nr:tetratricopeptide repeat protein [Armatimonadaceae bacterium]